MKGVYKISGEKPGPAIAILGGVHGNEPVGVTLIQDLRESLHIDAGTAYLILANTEAIAQSVRSIEKNLNRCFMADNAGQTYEDQRAHELMSVLDQCDALLDIHSFTNPDGAPFVICEEDAFPIATKFDVGYISSGWTDVEPGGTDDYMHRSGKVGICFETGTHGDVEAMHRAKNAVNIFLGHFGLIAPKNLDKKSDKKEFIRAYKAIVRQHEEFFLSPAYKNFDTLAEGEVYVRDGDKEYVAEKGDCIMLPTPNEPIGGEACVIGKRFSI